MERGFFGVGVQYASKAGNIGAIYRTAHAFGASFIFSIGANYKSVSYSDTSSSTSHIPYYKFNNFSKELLPVGTKIVAVELTQDAISLPNFYHPLNAVYILGPEKGSITNDILDISDYKIKIPTSFCVNVSIAAAITLYDRKLSKGSNMYRAFNENQEIKKINHKYGNRFEEKVLSYKSEIDFPLDGNHKETK